MKTPISRFPLTCALLCLTITTGCLKTRSHRPSAIQPSSPIVLLPMGRADLEADKAWFNKLRRCGNRALDDLASAGHSTLIGPSLLRERCGDINLSGLTVTGFKETPWEETSPIPDLDEFIAKAGTSRMIRTHVNARGIKSYDESYGLAGGGAWGWSGHLVVEMELFDLATSRSLGTSISSASGTGHYGVLALFIPIMYGETVGHTLEKTIREALDTLLENCHATEDTAPATACLGPSAAPAATHPEFPEAAIKQAGLPPPATSGDK